MKSRALSQEVLERLDRVLADQQVVAAATARPGASADVVEAAVSPLGLELAAEARLWWAFRTWGRGFMLPGLQFWPVEESVEHYAWRRQYAEENQTPAIPRDVWWDPAWLPVFAVDGGEVLVMDLESSSDDVTQIRTVDWQLVGGPTYGSVVADSLGALINERLDAIEAGQYRYDSARDIWLEVV